MDARNTARTRSELYSCAITTTRFFPACLASYSPLSARAIEVSPALKVYVCNVATQHGETDAFKVSDHFATLKQHLHGSPFDFVLANSNTNAVLPEEWHSEPVRIDSMSLDGARVMKADVVAEENRYRHDSKKLADALIRLYYERNQIAAEAEVLEAQAPAVEAAAQKAGVG